MASKVVNDSWSSMSEGALIQNFPLHRACRDGDVAQLINLLQQKDSAYVHMCIEDKYYGWTPFHWAAYFGKLDCLRILVEASNSGIVNLKTSRFNQTPAHIAAFAGHPHCLQWLIQSGADVNVRDYLAETPLHKAARTGSEECVSLLVNNKAFTGVKNDSDKTPAELAQLCRHASVATFLLNLPKQESSVRSLVSSNGYYGYQPLNGSVFKGKVNPGHDPRMEMDTEDAIVGSHVNGTNGFHSPAVNGHRFQNDILSAAAAPARVLGFTNGTATGTFRFRNGLEEDITLSEDVSQNRVAIAGKKRSREEAVIVQQTKRIRTEGLHPPHSRSSHASPTNHRVPFNNISNCGITENFTRTQISIPLCKDGGGCEHAKNAAFGIMNAPKLQENRRYKPFHLSFISHYPKSLDEDDFDDASASEMNDDFIGMGVRGGVSGVGMEAEGLSLDEEDVKLASELLRETHGCESYFLRRDRF